MSRASENLTHRGSPVDQPKLEQFSAVEMIPLQFDRQINGRVRLKQTMREFPRDTVQATAAPVLKAETKMQFLEYFRRRIQHHSPHPKDGLRVALAART